MVVKIFVFVRKSRVLVTNDIADTKLYSFQSLTKQSCEIRQYLLKILKKWPRQNFFGIIKRSQISRDTIPLMREEKGESFTPGGQSCEITVAWFSCWQLCPQPCVSQLSLNDRVVQQLYNSETVLCDLYQVFGNMLPT